MRVFRGMPLGEQMQSKLMKLVTMGIPLLLVALCSGCSSQSHKSAGATADTQAVLGVDNAVRNLKPDTTARIVTGVVRTVSPEDKLLTLIDVEEYKTCGLSDCCLYMPVRWQGEMPKMKDIVTVEGTIEATESGVVFSASKLHVDENAATQ
jgi:hypothetical protein